MAEDDEIDILGDFSFNSCLAQNRQGIPSCSDREDTIHPQWLLDSTLNNWYDKEDYRLEDRPSNIMIKKSPEIHLKNQARTIWNQAEKEILSKEMEKYGRDVKKIAQLLTTKSEAEIQALIEAEYGINLETPGMNFLGSHDNSDDEIPAVVQEEVITDDDAPSIANVLNMVTTGSPTVPIIQNMNDRRNTKKSTKKSLLKPEVLMDIKKVNSHIMKMDTSSPVLDDDLIIGSIESVGSDNSVDHVIDYKKVDSKVNNKRDKIKKKIGNHRMKVVINRRNQKQKCRKSENIKSPEMANSGVSENDSKVQKMQIILGSGQALPLCKGEEVIKIQKKNSDAESDIEVDVDSDTDDTKSKCQMLPELVDPPMGDVENDNKAVCPGSVKDGGPVKEMTVTSQRSLERLLKGKVKIDLGGGGGCTIAHTDAGDVYAVSREPRRRPAPRTAAPPPAPPVHLIHTRPYSRDKPAPFTVSLHVSALITMDVQAHCSRGEVMGLVGGGVRGSAAGLELVVTAYQPAAAAASRTHCDMCPVSQALAAEKLRDSGLELVGWHHSHPRFPPNPSAQDLSTQLQLQQALERPRVPWLGIITSQHWPVGRDASQYKCIRVELEASGQEVGYQLCARLEPDLTDKTVHEFVLRLRDTLTAETQRNEFTVEPVKDVCPDAKITYLKKCLSSVRHHMRSAGYGAHDSIVSQLLRGIADIFR